MPRTPFWTGLLWMLLPAIGAADTPRDLPSFSETVQVVDALPFLVPVDRGDRVRVRFPVGELEILAAPVSAVETRLAVGCERLSEAMCEKYRGRLRLEASQRDGAVEVRLTGLPKWKLRRLQLEGEVKVPRWAPLEVRVGIGDVDIHAGDEDLVVTMGIGDLTVHAAQDRVRSVRAATRIGDASLRGRVSREGKRRMLLGAHVEWYGGTGPASLALGLKIGDASVVLE